jgi:hypothetical protein
MTHPVTSVERGTTLAAARKVHARTGLRAPVLERGRFLGLLRRRHQKAVRHGFGSTR